MKLYRGQPYGGRLGEWWSRSRTEAEGFARVRRSYVVLCIDVPGRWARQFKDAGTDAYVIPRARLSEGTTAALIVAGMVEAK